ncbi:DNA metabolism protein [Chlorobaculum thiosulfatiphilum]|uniref:DNA metabolism protein n=1 Tax=Chlorobaculum thiosulfatiphilum TaxID=115852 RepID=A0A5C4S257_CHLTI|nr:TIGR03915 family putative DNA repair protein [Chlorobaculum thiosulfatiphilum]TNJ36821.1 DNA metabolism protein [Chlorobaculum thiosulfatiphilum]
MNQYLYDGTPEGLVSAIASILDSGENPEEAHLAVRQDMLFEEGLFLRTDSAFAEALFERLRQRAPDAVQTLWYFMMAEADGLETSLLRYIALAFEHGDRVNGYLTHTSVKAIVGTARKAGRELHRMKGLMRFEQLRDGAWLARMEPDCNVMHPLARHFSRRLRAQEWFIFDARRRSAAHWDGHDLSFGTLEQFSRPELSLEERAVQQLWQTFFKTIAIPERKNPRLQQSNMPAKYWKYLTEKQGE